MYICASAGLASVLQVYLEVYIVINMESYWNDRNSYALIKMNIIGFGDYLNTFFVERKRKSVMFFFINNNKKRNLRVWGGGGGVWWCRSRASKPYTEVEKLGIPRKFLSNVPWYPQLIQGNIYMYIHKYIYVFVC